MLPVQLGLGISWYIQLVYCLLGLLIILAARFANVEANPGVLNTLITFVAVFTLLTVFLVLYQRTKYFAFFIMPNIFAVN